MKKGQEAMAVKAKPVRKPFFGHEQSRHQYMCRSGLPGPGQNHAIQYNPKKKGDQDRAKKAAEKWLREEMARFEK